MLAFLPKVTQVLLVIPDPVLGAYAMVIIAVLFMLGTRIVLQDGMDYRKATVVGFSFWVGVGCQSGQIPTDALAPLPAAVAQQRDDLGGTDRARPDRVHGADGAAAHAHADGVASRVAAEDPAVSGGLRQPPGVGGRDGEPAGARGRGDAVAADR